MPSSTGSELSSALQAKVDRLWVACVNCNIADRQDTWKRGLLALNAAVGGATEKIEDALQDAGHRLGIFHMNAKAARFYGAIMGVG